MAGAPQWPADGGVVGVVVHPRRTLDTVLASTRAWAEAHGGVMRQVPIEGQDRRVADLAAPEDCDLLLALGGDGTVLASLRAAAPGRRPVLGVACGSLGALTSVKAPDVEAALDRFAAGEWDARPLPGLEVRREGELLGTAFNDLAIVRKGAGQVIVGIEVDDGPYARMAGDGLIVATPLGSSAYTLAAGGPLVAAIADVVVLTPLAAHGGSVPPVIVSASSTVTVDVDGGWSGARIEMDGRVVDGVGPEHGRPPFTLEVTCRSDAATLLDFDGETLIAGLRRRGLIVDSPRLAVRDARKTQTG